LAISIIKGRAAVSNTTDRLWSCTKEHRGSGIACEGRPQRSDLPICWALPVNAR